MFIRIAGVGRKIFERFPRMVPPATVIPSLLPVALEWFCRFGLGAHLVLDEAVAKTRWPAVRSEAQPRPQGTDRR